MSRVDSGEPLEGVFDQLPNADLFEVQGLVSNSWYDKLLIILTNGVLSKKFTIDQRRKFALKSKPFLVIARALYGKVIDQIIKRCVPNEEQ